jgi:hypothetical protein
MSEDISINWKSFGREIETFVIGVITLSLVLIANQNSIIPAVQKALAIFEENTIIVGTIFISASWL